MACEINGASTTTEGLGGLAGTGSLREGRGASAAPSPGSPGTFSVNSGAVKNQEDLELEEGRVEEIRRIMLLYGDHGMAHRLQDGEYAIKKDWNRQERRTARTDVPVAIETQTEEDREREIQELERLEKQKQIMDEDERMARHMEREESGRRGGGAVMAEGGSVSGAGLTEPNEEERCEDDAEMARRLMNEELLQIEREKIRRELTDEDFARRLQLAIEEEERDGGPDLPLRGRNPLLLGTTSPWGETGDEMALGGQGGTLGGTTFVMGRFRGFEVDPSGAYCDEMSEGERRAVLQLQDEELAKALQEQENMRSMQLHTANTTESRDEQLAYVMQQLEQLRADQLSYGGPISYGPRPYIVIQPPSYGSIPTYPHTAALGRPSPDPYPYPGPPDHPTSSPPAYQPQQSSTSPVQTGSSTGTVPTRPSRRADSAGSVPGQTSQSPSGTQTVGTRPVIDSTTSVLTVTAVDSMVDVNTNSAFRASPNHDTENFVNELGEHYLRQNSQPSSLGGSPSPTSTQVRALPTPPQADRGSGSRHQSSGSRSRISSSRSSLNSTAGDEVFMSPGGGSSVQGQTSRSMSVGSDPVQVPNRRQKKSTSRKTSCKTQ